MNQVLHDMHYFELEQGWTFKLITEKNVYSSFWCEKRRFRILHPFNAPHQVINYRNAYVENDMWCIQSEANSDEVYYSKIHK